MEEGACKGLWRPVLIGYRVYGADANGGRVGCRYRQGRRGDSVIASGGSEYRQERKRKAGGSGERSGSERKGAWERAEGRENGRKRERPLTPFLLSLDPPLQVHTSLSCIVCRCKGTPSFTFCGLRNLASDASVGSVGSELYSLPYNFQNHGTLSCPPVLLSCPLGALPEVSHNTLVASAVGPVVLPLPLLLRFCLLPFRMDLSLTPVYGTSTLRRGSSSSFSLDPPLSGML